MVVKEILGNITRDRKADRSIDLIQIEWYEATKRIQRLRSDAGVEVAIKFLKEGQRLREGDILMESPEKLLVVHIKPCEAIVIQPESMLEMGTVCYEIGNKHMPLFIQGDEVLMPFEMPMYRWLEASGYKPTRHERQLLHLLKSNVEPHQHGGTSLFSKIMNLAACKE